MITANPLIRFFVMIPVLCIAQTAAAQQTLSGTVKDTADDPLPAATITLLKASDSTWLQSAITDSNGRFILSGTNTGAHILDVQAIGYLPVLQPINIITGENKVDITLQKSHTTNLDEVTVSGKRPYIESGLGKTIVNFPTASIPAGSTLLELLRKSPGILVDGNGNISLQGKGVLVLIDDKQTYLSGAQLADYLRSTPAEQVTQIELMTQPSARYDAEGSGGIINIKVRKNSKTGWNGNASLSISLAQLVKPGTTNSVNLYYKKARLNVFANIGYLHIQGYLDQQTTRHIKDSTTGALNYTVQEKAFLKETFEDYNLRLGADYSLTDKTSIGASIKGIYHPNKERDDINANMYNITNSSILLNKSTTTHKLYKNSIIANAYARFKPAKDQDISVDLDYLLRDYRNEQHFTSINSNEQTQQIPDNLILNSILPSKISIYSIRADYNATLRHNVKLEAGLKSSYVKADNGAYFQRLENGSWMYDSVRTNNFIYRESISAAYVNVNKKIGEKIEVQLGLRLENTTAIGKQYINDHQFKRNYTTIFPTAFISYKMNELHSFEFSYGKRINRPPYIDLNPFIRYSSQYQYTTGNPSLQPRYEHSLGLKHNFKDMLFTAVDIGAMSDVINPVTSYDSTTKTVINTVANNADNRNAHASLAFSKDIAKWCSLTLGSDIYYQEYRLNRQQQVYASSWTYTGSLTAQFNLNKDWNTEVYYQYITAYQQSMTETTAPWHWLGATLSKKIWKDDAILKLTIDDPFRVYQNTVESNWNNIKTRSVSRWANQRLALSFTYNFGKQTSRAPQRNNIDEAKRL